MSITFRKRPDHTLSVPDEPQEPHLDLHSIDARLQKDDDDDDIPVLIPETNSPAAAGPSATSDPYVAPRNPDNPAASAAASSPFRRRETAGPVHIPPPSSIASRDSLSHGTPAWQDDDDEVPVLTPGQHPASAAPYSPAARDHRAPVTSSTTSAAGTKAIRREPMSANMSFVSPTDEDSEIQAREPYIRSSAPPTRAGSTHANRPYTSVPNTTPDLDAPGSRSISGATHTNEAIPAYPETHSGGAPLPGTTQAGLTPGTPKVATEKPATTFSSRPESDFPSAPAHPADPKLPAHPAPEDYAPFLRSARGAHDHPSKPELYVWSDDDNDAFAQAARGDFTLNRIEPTAGKPTFDASLFRAPSRQDALASVVTSAREADLDSKSAMQAEIDALVTELLDESHQYLKRRFLEEIPEIIAKYHGDR